MSQKRVGIIALLHESNTFFPAPTTVEDFSRVCLARGPGFLAQFQNAHHEVTGFLQTLPEESLVAVPIFAARTTPSGTITGETVDTLLGMMFEELGKAGPLDGLLVAPHGAAVSEPEPDMDGYWLSLLRDRVGPGVPIVCTLDPHANLTPRMISSCTATIAYRSNPHLDQKQRGVEAARLMARTIRGEVRPTQAAAFPPVAINIERQLTSASPCRELYALADYIAERPGVLSNSVFLGFPYADVPEMGSAFSVVTDGDAGLAQTYADQLAGYLWEHRGEFIPELFSPDQAIERAMRSPGPVCLLDMGDNVGGGAPGDSTILARALHGRGIRSFVCLHDPRAVIVCQSHAPGDRFALTMGGSPSLSADVTLVSMHEGIFTEAQPRHGGHSAHNLGATAVVRTDSGVTVQLTTRRAMPSSLNQLLSFGLDPAEFRVIVAKGVHAPVAAYAPACPTLIRVNTPGITTADMTGLPYRRRRRPLFPFEADAGWAGGR